MSLYPFQFPSFLSPITTHPTPIPSLEVSTSGNVTAKVECKELEGVYMITAEVTGIEKETVEVAAEEGGVVRIIGGGGGVGGGSEGRLVWRVALPRDAELGTLTWSMENAVVTVVVPKAGSVSGSGSGFGLESLMGGVWDWEGNGRRNNVRVVEIEGPD